ncbi:MAG: hypothetical protein ABIP06_08955 [Pyrinomonadaceae bacterium]
MPNAGTAEIYFISAMMILIFAICGAAVYFFAVTYKREMRERKQREEKKLAAKKLKAEAAETETKN